MAEFEKELGPEHGVSHDGVPEAKRDDKAVVQSLVQSRRWKAPVETDEKKALKWRRRMHKEKEKVAVSPILEAIASDIGSLSAPEEGVEILQGLGRNRSEGEGGKRRPTRASRRSKLMCVYTMNTSGRPVAIRGLSKLAENAKSIAAVAIQGNHCTENVVQDLQQQAGREGWKLHAVLGVIKS